MNPSPAAIQARPRVRDPKRCSVAGLIAVLLALGGGLLGGCAARTPVEAPEIVTQPLPAPASLPYRLQPGDLVEVKFWGAGELDEEVRVRPDGKISLPFIDEVDAAGRTPDQLDAELTTLYASELARPNITVIVREATAPRIYIGGEVGRQGALEITEGLTLFRAIQEAGGFTTTAKRQQVVIIRATADGRAVARAVDLMPVLSGEDPDRDVVLAANDVVFVPRTKIKSVSLFVQQYIDEIVPLQNVLGGLLLADITQDDDTDTTAADAAPAADPGGGGTP
ncbi:MAG: polysaccharide biosynthesis/export family protein [Acidobacteriota bacterium]